MWDISHLTELDPQLRKCRRKCVPKIAGHRRGEHSDLPVLDRLMSIKTYDIFGDVEIGRVYESSCLTVIQYDEKGDVISGICLCNYPNVPSVTAQGWLHWLKTHYGMENITERNTLFVHCLVWDDRYADEFLKHLLTAVFDMDVYTVNVILVLPPRVTPDEAFTRVMTRIVPIGFEDTNTVQALYTTTRYSLVPRLKIRRAVEEDNDDIIPIIDADSTYVKEIYGEYYISEMTRHPDDRRRLIVSEDDNGFATGTMCLNSTIDLNVLDENFELTVYGGLRKIRESEQSFGKFQEIGSEVLSVTYIDESSQETVKSKDERKSSKPERIKDDEVRLRTSAILDDDGTRKISSKSIQFVDATLVSSDVERHSEDVQIKEIYRRRESPSKERKHVRISEVVYENDGSLVHSQQSVEQEQRHSSHQARSSLRKTSLKKDKSHRESKNDNDYEVSLKSTKNSESNRILTDGLSDINDSNTDTIPLPTSSESIKHIYVYIRRSQRRIKIIKFFEGMGLMFTAKFVESDLSTGMQTILPVFIYRGEANAFVIEIFTMREDIGNRGTREFLEAAFESYPDLDYCTLLVPSAYQYFSLLEHFTRVPLRYNKDFPMSLYLAHKAVLFGKISCRKADSSDEAAILRFLGDVPKRKEIMRDFFRTMNRSANNFFSCIFECDDVIIGLAIVRINEDHEGIMRNYHVEDFISSQYIRHDAHGRLLHFILMPIFSVHQKFLFCEIMRLCELTVLYYRLYEGEVIPLTRTRPIISCLHAMVPVNPRKRMEYKFCMCSGMERANKMRKRRKKDRAFSLFLTTPRIAMISNRIIDTKIVVVGASDCALALLEFLVFGYPQNFIHFTNITLISPNGLPYEKKRDGLKWEMIPFRGRYCRDYRRHLIAGRAWINVVRGTVVLIKRNEKYVVVTDHDNLSYDFLILTCGLQYQKTLFDEEETGIMKRGDVKSENIWNCLTINDDTEAFISLEKVRLITNDFKEKKAIVFYGHNIDCYCALYGLIKHGVAGSWITLIEPKLDRCDTHDTIFFHNCEVDVAITNAILENEINILSGWNIIDWTLENFENDKSLIQSIVIRAGATIKTVPCDIFFNFSEKKIDLNSFLAISCAGLVFNNRLLISPEFRTNDPFVFAAGTVTKYARKFDDQFCDHKYYNRIEIGERLGKVIRKVIEAYQEHKGRWEGLDRSKSSMLLPHFQSPVIVSCLLPGDYYYLHVGRPGKKLPRDIAIRQSVYGDVMITGTCSSEIGYFRLRLDAHDTAISITCCTKNSFEVSNFIELYGKHDSMLNEVKYRFEKSLISDFYAYFQEPWAHALFYDRFECLRVENRATLSSKAVRYSDCHADSLLEDSVRVLLKNEGKGISIEDRELIAKKYVGSVYQQEVENSVVDFLQFSEQALPDYCTPRLMRWMYADIESSPLFFEQ